MRYRHAYQNICCNFAAVKQDTRRHIASWLLLAVFVPMLLLSSIHTHESSTSAAEKECADCVHHDCHGHLTQKASWAHDCVICQFQLLKMLTAAVVAVAVYVHVCRKYHAQPLCCYQANGCGVIVTRGPPTV